MRIALTGAEGLVGQILRKGFAEQFEVRPLTRGRESFPSTIVDVTDLDALIAAISGVEAVVHLAAAASLDAAWEDVVDTNIGGTRNVFEAARIAGVRKVVYASSGHVVGGAEDRAGAPLYDLSDKRVFDERTPSEPDSLYAVSKVCGEALGRYYSDTFGLDVLCIRLGTVLPGNDPKSDGAGRGKSASMTLAQRYPRIRAKWLSHRDCCQVFAKALLAQDVRFGVFYATSNNPRQIWSLTAARERLGYEPQDAAPVDL